MLIDDEEEVGEGGGGETDGDLSAEKDKIAFTMCLIVVCNDVILVLDEGDNNDNEGVDDATCMAATSF
jgi:hypothetical protein